MKPGDVVVGAFPGAQITKTRPAVVLSTEDYHRNRPGVVVGLITTQVPKPFAPTDCELLDWKQAGLHAASYFRLFPVTLPNGRFGSLGDSPMQIGIPCGRASNPDLAQSRSERHPLETQPRFCYPSRNIRGQ